MADAVNDAVTTLEDTPVTIAVLANDSFEGANPHITEINGNPVTVGTPVSVSNGTVTLTPDGKLVFTPDDNWHGNTNFTYTANTDSGIEEQATVNVTVTSVNDVPEAVGLVPAQNDADTDPVATLDMKTFFNDVEDGTILSYTATGLPDGLSIDAATGLISGTLTNNASQGGTGGVHTVVVTATDSDGASTTQTFTWTVTNPEPVANNDTVTVAEDTVLTGNVLTDNTGGHQADSDPDGDPLTVVRYTVEGQTYTAGATAVITGGTLTLNANGSYTFTPTSDWNGTVPAVTYTISDGNGGVDTAVLQITVTLVNDAATISGDAVGAVTEAGGVANAAVGSPSTGGQLIVGDVDAGENRFQTPDAADLKGTYGNFVFDPLTGVWSYQLDNSLSATQALNAGETDTDTLTVTSQDGTATETITVTITGANDAPYVTSNAAAAQGSVVEAGIDASGNPIGNPTATGTLTADDADAEDDAASLNWSLSNGGNSATGIYGSLTLNAAGEWAYSLNNTQADGLKAGETRSETFTAVVTDAQGASTQQVITITITGSNDAPVISGAATGNVAEDGVQTATGQLDKADVDVGDTHTWSIEGATGTYGTLAVDQTGKWTYALDNTAAQAIPKGQTVQDTITVRVTDAAGAYSEQLVTINITGENDAPVILGSSTLSGAVTELGDGAVGENTVTREATGRIDFSDIDSLILADTHTVQSVTPQGAGYLGTLSLGAVDNDNDTVGWTFQVDDSAIDHLADGEVLTQRYDVLISDGQGGTAVTTVTVTITGVNNAPVIDTAASELSVTVTEITDGAAGENTHVHGHQGYVYFSDADTTDVIHTATVAPPPAGYLGDFTITPVDNVNDRVQWQFKVPDSVLDTLPQDETIVQEYEITISDGKGGTTTETVTVTIVGTNDQPLVKDDLTLAQPGDPIVMDVLDNDNDIDDGEKADLKVTHVDGQPIIEGTPLTLLDGGGNTIGTVTLNGDGELTFVPGPAFTGSINLPYTVDDGSGASNATATANWLINVIGVDIVDNTSPGTPGTGDNVLASIDNLNNVRITGQSPVGGSITGLTVEDESGNIVTVPAGNITVNPDGSFSTTANLSGLEDGDLIVTLTVTDGGGHTGSITDTILKDTETVVTIDPLLVVDGQVPTITGTGEPGSTITLTIDGVEDPDPVMVQPDGTWSYTPSAPLDSDEATIAAVAEDPYGNTDNDSRTVAGLNVEDKVADVLADILVYEAGLTGGSNAAANSEQAQSTFTLGLTDGIKELVIGGTVTDRALAGGTTVSVHQLEALADSGAPIPAITTTYGTLTLTSYNETTGVVEYTYTLSDKTAHPNANGNNTVYEDIQIAVVDSDDDTRVGKLRAGVVDDVPEADDDTPVSVAEGGLAVGSANDGDNLLDNDTLGADGGRVHDISYLDRDGDPVTNHAVPNGGSTTVETQYGSLTVHSNGTWSYEPLPSADHVKATHDTQVTDDFTYRVIDNDGDISNAATQAITVTDTVPNIGTPVNGEVSEAGLPLGSDQGGASSPLQASGTLNVQPGEDSFGVAFDPSLAGAQLGLESGGETLFYVLTDSGRTLTAHKTDAAGDAVFTVVITNPTASNAGYQFTLDGVLDHGGAEELDLNFGVVMTDSDGDTATAQFTVTVLDDKSSDTVAYTVNEDGDTTFNTSADANPDNTKIFHGGNELVPDTTHPDGSKDYKTNNGTVTVNADGTITYEPDEHFSGTEVFTYQTNDGGTIEETEVTMTVNPVSDAPTLTVEDASITTFEDTPIGLGLKAPVIIDTDNASGTGNNAEGERIGVVTLEGIPADAVLLQGDGTTPWLTSTGGPITIVLSDVPTVTGTTGTLTMTTAQFEALQVRPPEHAHENFVVTVKATSYEVDASGDIAVVDGDPVPGAESTATVSVDVHAVTDAPALVLVDPADPEAVGAVTLSTTAAAGGTPAQITAAINEDSTLQLQSVLQEAFVDTDGTEQLWYVITGLPAGTEVTIGGTTYTSDGGPVSSILNKITIDEAGENPVVSIKPPENYSNSAPINVQITLNVQDSDADSPHSPPDSVGAQPAVESVTVDLSLRVFALPDDVELENPAASPEDTAVAFLANLTTSSLLDSGEFITEVRLTGLPDEGGIWKLFDHVGTELTIPPGGDATDGGLELMGSYTLAQIQQFTLLPPPHSSLDGNLKVYVTTTEAGSNTQSGLPESREWEHSLKVTVTPVAEEIGKETASPGDDLAMNGDHDYTTPGREDQWFALSTDGFDMKTPWGNQDGSEQTYARLTPNLIGGDGAQTNANGSKFQWFNGTVWVEETYTGTPIDVPVDYLDTLQLMAPPDFSGMFEIKVQAYTVDVDEDGGTTSEAVSGEATLTNILIMPVADEVMMALNGRADGLEDTPISLSIRPSSTDKSETFNVTIADIPVGATITYGSGAGQIVFTATAGSTSLTIENFNSALPMTVQPPPHSNVDFTLKVSAVSVDTLTYEDPDNPGSFITETETSTWSGPALDIAVTVKGVADPADVVALSPPAYIENELDAGTDTVKLSDLVSIVTQDPQDTDGSETLTVRVTGLADGFSPSAGTLLTSPDITGADRVWVLTEAQYESVTIRVPQNYSGTVTFQVAAVTTENDGSSLTGVWHGVGFTVTPSPEAETSTTVTVDEDVLTGLNLEIAHQNGDTDETLGNVRIKVADVTGADFTLYLGSSQASAKTLAQALTDGDISTENVSGEDYYLISAAQVEDLWVLGAAHLDDGLGGFDFQYQVIDGNYGSISAGTSVTSDWQDDRFTITATPVTDQPKASITGIVGGVVTNEHDVGDADDKAIPDTAALDAPGTVTVNLNVQSPDSDGSEQLVRVLIEGVPPNVVVKGAELIASGVGGDTWLLVYDGADAKSINSVGGIDLPVEFELSDLPGQWDAAITMTVQVQDRGTGGGTEIESDSVTWYLEADIGAGDTPVLPAEITAWRFDNAQGTEDAAFTLSEVMIGAVDVQSLSLNMFTITIKDLPPGSLVSGMVETTIGGQSVWTASTVSTQGMNAEDIEALLGTLMDSITITPPADWNDNQGSFSLDATLTTAVVRGRSNNTENASADVPIKPVTDEAVFSITVDPIAGELNESDSEIPLNLTVSNAADGTAGSIVDGTLYLQISADQTALQDGTLEVDGTTYTLQTIGAGAVPGLPAGDYYVVTGVTMGNTVPLVYTPSGAMAAGNVTVNAWVLNQETDASNGANQDGVLTSAGSATIEVLISNDGVTIGSAATTGSETAVVEASGLAQLQGLSVTLNDNDTSEKIESILLGNLPDGFLVFVGNDAASAELASNAGSEGPGGMNTWVLSDNGVLPPYVAILPPQYWSGTLNGLTLIVESGETALNEKRVDTATLEPVTITPVADGIVITPTATFGSENGIVPLNLNSAMRDTADAGTVLAPDSSRETVTIQITGLGEHASFYLGNAEIDASRVTISGSGASTAYTITGLSQAELDQLGFKQARSALVDQDGDTGGVQISVDAWTVESGAPGNPSAPESSTITLSVSSQLATSGDDTLIWTGNAINGRSGTDTVQLRSGEDLSGAELALRLTNIEVIDLSVGGANQITDLTPEQLKAIAGSGSELEIKGAAADGLTLDGNWVDNNDGTYTGTFDDNGTPVDVTLTVSGGVDVTMPSGLGGFGGMPFSSFGFSPFLAGFDGMEGSDDDSDFLFDDDGELPAWSGVLGDPADSPDSTGDSLSDWLPGGTSADQGMLADLSGGVGGEVDSYAYVPNPLDNDELEQSLHGNLVG
ncbi:MAG: VCBS domain-containing protein [Pigmentiphaga sp.]|nr:VCBS domain-containing protein [Pigmentiphaga sp.]